MEWIIANYDLIVIGLVLLGALGYGIYYLLSLPTVKRKELVSVWLLSAVIEAEKIYKSETGRIKFSYVYNLFIDKFPILSKLLPKKVFEELVELALIEMRNQIESNTKVREYVEGDK